MKDKRPDKKIIKQQKQIVESFVNNNLEQEFNILNLVEKFNIKKARLIDLLDVSCCRNGLILNALCKNHYNNTKKDFYIIKINK